MTSQIIPGHPNRNADERLLADIRQATDQLTAGLHDMAKSARRIRSWLMEMDRYGFTDDDHSTIESAIGWFDELLAGSDTEWERRRIAVHRSYLNRLEPGAGDLLYGTDPTGGKGWDEEAQ